MSDFKIRRRNRLKSKAAKALRDDLTALFGADWEVWPSSAAVETAEVPGLDVIIVDQVIEGLTVGDKPFLSLRGLLRYKPTTRWVTVDMGAVRFVTNGADVMAPGITDADPALAAGDLAWIRDEKNGQPLAVAECLMSGPEMAAGSKGKALRSIHYIGDKVWLLDDA